MKRPATTLRVRGDRAWEVPRDKRWAPVLVAIRVGNRWQEPDGVPLNAASLTALKRAASVGRNARVNPSATRTAGLLEKLERLRPKMAAAAQVVYDDWNQDEDGFDEDVGGGGICDQIAGAIGVVVLSKIRGVDITEGGQDGDDHAFAVVLSASEAVAIDIPPSRYESGGGYSWRKKSGVVFRPTDIVLEPLSRSDFDDVESD